MGFPGDTVEVPCIRPDLAAVVASAALDPYGVSDELSPLLAGKGSGPGHLTASAWVFDLALTQILLVQHTVLGWSQPGGHVEAGEPPQAAAIRELEEETGLALVPSPPNPAVLHRNIYPARAGHPAHVHWSIGFAFVVARVSTADLRPEQGTPVGWWRLDGLPIDRAPHVAELAIAVAALLAGKPCRTPSS